MQVTLPSHEAGQKEWGHPVVTAPSIKTAATFVKSQTNLLFYSHVGQIQHEGAGVRLKSHKNQHTIQYVHTRYTELLNLQMPSSWHKNSRTNWHLPAFWQIPTGTWLIQIHPNYSSVIRMTGRCHRTLSVQSLLCKTNVFLRCHLIICNVATDILQMIIKC